MASVILMHVQFNRLNLESRLKQTKKQENLRRNVQKHLAPFSVLEAHTMFFKTDSPPKVGFNVGSTCNKCKTIHALKVDVWIGEHDEELIQFFIIICDLTRVDKNNSRGLSIDYSEIRDICWYKWGSTNAAAAIERMPMEAIHRITI